MNRDGDEGLVALHRVNAWGNHELHVTRVGKQVRAEFWIDAAVKAGADPETILQFAYEEAGTHHLKLWWAPLEDDGRLRLPALPVQGEQAKMWTRTNGENAWREVKKGVWKLE